MWILLVVLVVVALAAVVAARLVHRVPPGHVGVVLRDGSYLRLVTPGLLWLPAGEQVRTVSTLEQQVRVERAPLTSHDARRVEADLRVGYRVDDPVRSLSAVHDAAYAVERDALVALRAFAAGTTGAELAAGSRRAADHVRDDLAARLRGWGLELLRVEVVVRADAG